MITQQRIIELLDSHPDGVTTEEVSMKLGGKPSTVSGRLSKLHAYGVIKRTHGPGRIGKPIWMAKAKVTA
jgi:predicted transcriptional regulator